MVVLSTSTSSTRVFPSFFSFHPPDFDFSIAHLQSTLQPISSWMTANLYNFSKTDFLLSILFLYMGNENSPIRTIPVRVGTFKRKVGLWQWADSELDQMHCILGVLIGTSTIRYNIVSVRWKAAGRRKLQAENNEKQGKTTHQHPVVVREGCSPDGWRRLVCEEEFVKQVF